MSYQKNSTLKTVALVFMWLTVVAYGIALIVIISGIAKLAPYGYYYPEINQARVMLIIYLGLVISELSISLSMTLKVQSGSAGTGIKVCVLIFVNILSGILLLCDREDDYYPEQRRYTNQPSYYAQQNSCPPSYYRQVKKTSGVWTCPHCGAENLAGAKFCANCKKAKEQK